MKRSILLLSCGLCAFHMYSQFLICDTVYCHFEIDKNNIDIDLLSSELEAKDWTADPDWTGVTVHIRAYTDCAGTAEHNLALSERRANAAKVFFSDKKYAGWNVTAQALGEDGCGAEVNEYNAARRITEIFLCRAEPEIKVTDAIVSPFGSAEMIGELQEGQAIVLQGLNFIGGRHIPLPEAIPVLEELLETMKANPGLEIEIQGHICCSPPNMDGLDFDTGEQNLSWSRAEYVKDFLEKNGIEARRLSYKGFARTRPLFDPETTPEEERANRRVEVLVTHK